MKRILLFCFMAVAMLVNPALAQERTVSGKVTSAEDGSGLPGVNVVIKGTSTGTVTDLDGNFKISVPDGAVLQISALSYSAQEIAVGSRSVIDVQLETDIKTLSEVVVTAGGIAREKKALGYSVQDVKGEEITKAREANLLNSLSGRVAGLQVTGASGGVGSSSRVVLRGASSLTGNNQPLFVVDGIPINNDNYGTAAGGFGGADRPNGAGEINPDDIASISVLKGPNAAALYGSRASNGVIVITTKTGKGTKGIGVSVNSSANFERPLRLPDYQNAYGGGYNESYFYYGDGTNGSGGEDESWGPRLDSGLEFVQWNDFDGQPSPWVSRPDNVENFFETGKTFQNNISISGGGDKAHFRLSLSNLDQTGMIPNTEMKRNTITVNSGMDVTEKFKVETSLSYIKSNSDNLPGGGYDNNNPMQQFTWFQRNVDIAALKDFENLPLAPAGTSAEGTPATWNTNYNNNPYWVLHNNTNAFSKDRLLGNVRLSYELTDWLSIAARTGTDYFTDLSVNKRAVGSNDFPNGNYQEITRTWQETNSDVLLTFNKEISDITVNASVGANKMRQVYERNTLEAPELEIPGVYSLANSKVAITGETFGQQKEIHSVYGSLNLGFRNYLFLDAVARNDWSSTLPIENNSYFYWSASLSVDITSILGLESDILNYAKLRGSYAKVGSDTDPYRLQNVYATFDPWGGSLIMPTAANDLNNPSLKPETTNSFEFGGEFKFWKNKIGLEVSYYDKKSIDQIMPVNISSSSGYTRIYANAGEMRNRGIELSLNATPVDMANGFKWDIAVNYNKNINEVTALADGLESLTIGTYWNASIVARPGEPYGTIFGPDFQRDPSGNIIHNATTGLPLKDQTNKVLGNVNPDWVGGLSNNFSFKGISLGVLIDAKMGGDIYSMTNAWGRYAGVLEETLLGRENGIVGDGVINTGTAEAPVYVENNIVVPAQSYNHAAFGNSVVAGSVFDASYIKLRQLTLGYSLPNSLIGNSPFKNITISVVGRNLALLYSKVPHIDPETSFGNGNLQGIEHAQSPSARSLGFNLSFNL